MDLSQLVPLYLTIIMVALVVIAMVGPGDKAAAPASENEQQDQ